MRTLLIEEFLSFYSVDFVICSVSFLFFRSFNNSNRFGVAVYIVDGFPLAARLRSYFRDWDNIRW